MVIPFQSLKSKLTELNRIQTNIDIFSRSLTNLPVLNGSLIENVDLTTVETAIPHRLNRSYKGWIVTKQNAAASIFSTSANLSSQFINLTASGPVTISIWVF